LVAMPTLGTGPAGVARINRHDGHTEQPAFVGDERTKLKECPPAHLRPLLLAKPGPVADALEVFKCDSSSGVFSQSNDLFADNVVGVSPESGLAVADPFHGPAGVLPGPSLVQSVHLLSEPPTD